VRPSEPSKDDVIPVADLAGANLPWGLFRVLALSALLLAVLLVGGLVRLPEGGAYPRFEHDHDDLMVSKTEKADATITVLFVGNSLTFRNDLPAMVVNLASSDPGNSTRLQVKAETHPNATLDYMLTQTGALAWAQDHHPDYVVLQEHSFWYGGSYEAARDAADRWNDALRPLHEAPLLFQVWADGEGSDLYTNKDSGAFGSTPAEDARNAAEGTERLSRRLGLPVVAVGRAFEAARETHGAPDVYGPDHHHPSVAGTYLAALVFYRFFTGRTGAEATYRPHGLSQQDAALLVRLSGG
jgi:hypothetical protein